MKTLIFLLSFLFVIVSANAALPPQFSECLRENSGTVMTVTDLKAISLLSRVTYCQNQVGIVGKTETMDLLRSPNIQVGISLSKTTYSQLDLMDLASSGSYVLYVDSGRLTRDNLIALAQANVQLVVMTATSGLSKADLLAIAAAKPFILNVNSAVSRVDLRDYVTAGVQVVIRTSQSGLSRADIIDVAQVNSEMVTIMP
ncbi:hypothetical protein [Bdellovibrio sp. BCCA]|uniref:hypothetical protein n=1 Tax=Bdellovibrio sp. BCCA TaxID=3136281 RepID=UPI0030F16866